MNFASQHKQRPELSIMFGPLLFCLRRHSKCGRLLCVCFTAALCHCATISASAGELNIVRKNADTTRPIRIVSQSASADGKQATVTFEPTDGIFAVDIDLGRRDFERLTFVVLGVESWEGVSFYPAGKKPRDVVELKDAADVTISARGKDCVIEFGPAAIKVLKQGGKFQFIDAYRG